MTSHARITNHGQIAVPADVRRALDVQPGDSVVFETEGDRVVIRKFTVEPIDEELAIQSFRERLASALQHAKPLPAEMKTDEYMAMIREPVPDPRI